MGKPTSKASASNEIFYILATTYSKAFQKLKNTKVPLYLLLWISSHHFYRKSNHDLPTSTLDIGDSPIAHMFGTTISLSWSSRVSLHAQGHRDYQTRPMKQSLTRGLICRKRQATQLNNSTATLSIFTDSEDW